ncbi:DUF4231 domain-containing protein [Olsenella uli]|uniref:DUF4231 domain-containing protein n=1 Tax=Olsenella uli TaxID=133926 RepID=UPI00325F9887
MLGEVDYPALWRDADRVSLNGQKWTLRYAASRFIGGVIAALGSIFSFWMNRINLAAVLALFGFCIAFFSEIISWIHRPEEKWYNGRAVAESIKTLVWRYSIGADPFQLELEEECVRDLLGERISKVLKEVPGGILVTTSDPFITSGMESLRKSSFEKRRDVYVEGRTKDQQEWYNRKAKYNQQRAIIWKVALVLIELAALVFAAMRITGGWDIDLSGFMAAFIAAAGGWIAVKQFSSLGAAYAVAAKELSIQINKLTNTPEADWALVAADAEEAISREHTMWLASRTGKQNVV